jgi:hypothetical protein
MKVYEVGIIYRFDAVDATHAIEQLSDAIVPPHHRDRHLFMYLDDDLAGAVNHIQELPSRDAASRFTRKP